MKALMCIHVTTYLYGLLFYLLDGPSHDLYEYNSISGTLHFQCVGPILYQQKMPIWELRTCLLFGSTVDCSRAHPTNPLQHAPNPELCR